MNDSEKKKCKEFAAIFWQPESSTTHWIIIKIINQSYSHVLKTERAFWRVCVC